MKLKFQILIVVILVGIIVVLHEMYKRELTERRRTDNNQIALLEGMKRYKTKDSLNVVSIQTITQKKNEFEKYNADLSETVNKLNLKVKRLQSVTSVATSTEIEFKTVLKDSLIYLPGKDSLIEMQCLEYKNAYVDFSGCFVQDTFNASIIIPDTLIHIAHRVPKNIWFIKFGTKSINLEILSKNPYTKIAYAKNIQFQKR